MFLCVYISGKKKSKVTRIVMHGTEIPEAQRPEIQLLRGKSWLTLCCEF